MRNLSRIMILLLLAGIATGVQAQFPKVKVKTPKVKTPKISGSSGGSSSGSSTSVGPKNDPSGLFTNVTDDPSAQSHRKSAVENLSKMEAFYSSESIDYEEFKKVVAGNEKKLGFIKKLEPDVNADKYYEKWNPLKERADKEIKNYDRVKELEDLIEKEFGASEKFRTPDPMTFRADAYGVSRACYCRTYKDHTKTYQEYADAKAEYEKLTGELVGYKREYIQERIATMTTCLENGNKYAVWASGENLKTMVEDYYEKENALKPKKVINRCDEYIAALERIETDYSLNLSAEAKTALSNGKAKTKKIKGQSEEYISSGKYQAHLDKLHAEKIAKVFLPKPVTRNSSLESGAKAYLKTSEYAEYADEAAVSTTVKASVQTTAPKVVKNEYDIPKYKYHHVCVSYKGKDGKCYLVHVYANYTYEGGGVYQKTPHWGADRPEEMACGNPE